MKKDRDEISRIVGKLLKSPNSVRACTEAYDALERLVDGARAEAIGWTHAYACTLMGQGFQDIRDQIVPEIIEMAIRDLS